MPSQTTNMMHLVDYRPAAMDFRWSERTGTYRHNVDRDLHGIAIWESARPEADAVLEEISKTFDVLQIYEIAWSTEHVASNFNRIYGRDPSGTSSRHSKVGAGPFLYVIAEDRDPDYVVWANISGKVEMTNRKIAHLKPRIRSMVETEAFPYNIHSSNSLTEFFRDAVLFLGIDIFNEALAAGFPKRHEVVALNQDMAGAGGWANLAEMFDVLRYACNVVVLRGYEEIVEANIVPVDEIDVLCDDLAALSGATCGVPTNDDPTRSAYRVVVGGREIKLDARSVGDGYYDARWQQRMLDTAHWRDEGFPALEPLNYFFSLLYHAKIQKPTVKPLYEQILPKLATTIGIPERDRERVTLDPIATRLLSGFLRANSYSISTPTDRGVYHNEDFTALLHPLVADLTRGTRPLALRLRRKVAKVPGVRRTYRVLKASVGR